MTFHKDKSLKTADITTAMLLCSATAQNGKCQSLMSTYKHLIPF